MHHKWIRLTALPALAAILLFCQTPYTISVKAQDNTVYQTTAEQSQDNFNRLEQFHELLDTTGRADRVSYTKAGVYDGLSAKKLAVLQEKAAAVTADATTTSKKIRAVYQFILENIQYQPDAGTGEEPDPYLVLQSGSADCSGLAVLFDCMLRSIDIPSLTLTGTVSADLKDTAFQEVCLSDDTDSNHMWNAVFNGRQWLCYDLSFDLAKDVPAEEEYYGLSAEQMGASHEPAAVNTADAGRLYLNQSVYRFSESTSMEELKLLKLPSKLTYYYVNDEIAGYPVVGLFDNYQNILRFSKETRKLEFAEGFTEIPDYYCYGLEQLNEVILPEGLTKIGTAAFGGCPKLSAVKLPNSLKEISADAFLNAKSLKTLSLPKTLAIIGDNAFRGSGLIKITVPASVRKLGKYAFSSCGSLETLQLSASVSTLPEGLASSCKLLKNVTLPKGLTKISSYAFADCRNLNTLTLPDSVTTVYSYAFRNCILLKSITFGTGTSNLAATIFNGCNNLDKVYFTGKTPPSIKSAFSVPADTCFYVNPASVAAYKAALYQTGTIRAQANPVTGY